MAIAGSAAGRVWRGCAGRVVIQTDDSSFQSQDRRRRFHVHGRVPNRTCGLVESQRSVRPEEGAYQIRLTRRIGLGEEALQVRPRGIAADAQLVGEPLDGLAIQHRHRHTRLGGREPEQSLNVPGGGDREACGIGNEDAGGPARGPRRILGVLPQV